MKKNIVGILQTVAANCGFVFVIIFVTLLIVDRCNPFMNFINNPYAKILLGVFCVNTVVSGILLLADIGKRKKRKSGGAQPAPSEKE